MCLKKQVKQRNDQLLRDYPELVNKLVLLLGAGMTMKGDITKMAMEQLLVSLRCQMRLDQGVR